MEAEKGAEGGVPIEARSVRVCRVICISACLGPIDVCSTIHL